MDAKAFVADHFNRTINTKKENNGEQSVPDSPFEKLVVTEGSKIQLRLGYSNNPSKLETVFNGQVVEVGISDISPDIIQLVCQSYAVQLVSETKGTEGEEEENIPEVEDMEI